MKYIMFLINSDPSNKNSNLAGFLDGEGSIVAYKLKQGATLPYVTVSCVNTVLRPIKLFQTAFGGTIFTRNKSGNGKIYKDLYTWRISDMEIVNYCLNKLSPYLIIKLDRAERALIIADRKSDPSLIKNAFQFFGGNTYIDNKERYEIICVICKQPFKRGKTSWKTCSRKCGYIYREQQSKGVIKLAKKA